MIFIFSGNGGFYGHGFMNWVVSWALYDYAMLLKGTLMQIWKSANIFDFIWKKCAEDFILKELLFFEKCAPETCEKEFLGLKMQSFQVIIFKWTQTYRDIFKSELVYL